MFFKIDKSVLSTEGKILFNISEQLGEIITILKPKESKEELMQQFRDSQGITSEFTSEKFICSCGKEFEKENRLRGHQIKCKAR